MGYNYPQEGKLISVCCEKPVVRTIYAGKIGEWECLFCHKSCLVNRLNKQSYERPS